MILTFWISALIAAGSATSEPIYSLANGSVVHIEYGDRWFGKYKFLEANTTSQTCKVLLHRASNKKLEDIATNDRLDLAIQYITYERTTQAPYRQLIKLVFTDGWIDCRFQQAAVVSLEDIANAFSSADVSYTLAETDSDSYMSIESLSVVRLQVDASDLVSLLPTTCFFTSPASLRLQYLHLQSFRYSSLAKTIGITYVSNEIPPAEGRPLQLYCEDTLDSVSRTIRQFSL